MLKLTEKYAAATRAFDDAKAKLNAARLEYVTGPGVRYTEIIDSAESYSKQITEYHQSYEMAKSALEEAIFDSGGKITPKVTEALSMRRNAEDLIEQSKIFEKHSEFSKIRAHVNISIAARIYINAYEEAAQCWAEMNMLAALVECAERIARAMAVVPVSERLIPYAIRTGEHNTFCRDRIWSELEDLRDSFKESDRSAYEETIGKLDLTPLKLNEILSPAEITKKTDLLTKNSPK
ncbi:hypothetical protein [Burkholderia gladioli]|uniref:hypothetical protein n=1 Tax=Burkholderia gladioli TaxID=28095 RepID=UPI0016411852|nr:hypothetical protein [Burkholderia gladioli]